MPHNNKNVELNITMRIISANTNGIRAAAKKGFFDWLKKVNPDVACIQETNKKGAGYIYFFM